MPDFGGLIDEVIGTLHGYTVDVPMAGSLAGPVTGGSTELALDFGDNPGAGRPNGLVEIGSELIMVTRYDANTGVATIPAWGRGQNGTTAVAHDADAKVIVRPRFPRHRVKQVINQVVAGSCPPLFVARDLTPIDTGALVSLGYTLPSDTVRVLRVDATDQGMPEELAHRRVLRDWTVRTVAGTQLLELNRLESYQTIQITVATDPGTLVSDADDFAAVTGLPESAADMVVFGAVARLIMGAELARQQSTTVEAQNRADKISAGSATAVSRYFQALYTQRLDAERDRLQQTHPIQLLRRG